MKKFKFDNENNFWDALPILGSVPQLGNSIASERKLQIKVPNSMKDQFENLLQANSIPYTT